MEKDEALKLLRGGPDSIKEWNELYEDGGEIPDLKNVDLSRVHLEGAWLREAHLEGAILTNAHLEGANLSKAHLEGAILIGAHLEEAQLSRAHLQGATFLSAHLEGANFYGAHLGGAMLFRAHLEKANFTAADLYGADLREVHLEGANLEGAFLEGANLSRAHLKGADFSRAHFEGADLTGADLSDASVYQVTYDRRRGKFQGVRVASCYGNALFKRDAQDQDYIETKLEKIRMDEEVLQQRIGAWQKQVDAERPGPHDNPSLEWWNKRWELLKLTRWEPVKLWGHRTWMEAWKLTDYGRSLWRVGMFGLVLALAFGVVYDVNEDLLMFPDQLRGRTGFWFTPYYYSIVTFTTLGFGDVKPKCTAGEIWVVAEVILGYVMLGLLVSILANKVARRS